MPFDREEYNKFGKELADNVDKETDPLIRKINESMLAIHDFSGFMLPSPIITELIKPTAAWPDFPQAGDKWEFFDPPWVGTIYKTVPPLSNQPLGEALAFWEDGTHTKFKHFWDKSRMRLVSRIISSGPVPVGSAGV